MEKKILDNTSGIEWNIRIVPLNALYGLSGQVINTDTEPLVEFFDSRYVGSDQLGFFVTRYRLSTLLKHEGGLCLNGSPPQYVDAAFMESLRNWLKPFSD